MAQIVDAEVALENNSVALILMTQTGFFNSSLELTYSFIFIFSNR